MDSSGSLDGLWTVYFEDGKKCREGKLHSGKEDGIWKEWHSNGKLKWKGLFENGRKTNKWKCWDDKGKRTSDSVYVDFMTILDGFYKERFPILERF